MPFFQCSLILVLNFDIYQGFSQAKWPKFLLEFGGKFEVSSLTLCMLRAQIWAEQKFLLHAAGPEMGPSTFRLVLPSVDRSDAKQAEKICSIFSIGSFVLSVTKIYHGLQ